MPKVILNGWLEGLPKVSLTKLIRAKSHLGLEASKGCVDLLLEGNTVEIGFPTLKDAESFMDEATEIGVVCKIEDDE